jgi:hypothetical protein
LRSETRFRARIKNPTLQKRRKIFAFKNLVLKRERNKNLILHENIKGREIYESHSFGDRRKNI